MTFRKLAAAAALSGAVLASAGAALAQDDSTVVVARVNGAELYLADLRALYERLPEQYRQLPFQMVYAPLLEQLVGGELVAAEGRKQGVGDDPDVRRQVRQFESVLVQRAYLERYVDENMTEDALRARYDETIAQATGEEQVTASHILLETEADATEVIGELNGGADFAELAKARSTGPSAPRGGSLGSFGRGMMVKEFEVAVFAMDVGSYSDAPVQTQFGWHVILLEAKEVAPPPSFEDSREELESELGRELIQNRMGELRNIAQVELFNPDGTPFDPDATPVPGEGQSEGESQ